MSINQHFSEDYAQARTQFLAAAKTLIETQTAGAINTSLQSFEHPTQKGSQGETLAMDVLSIVPQGAQKVLMITSAMHGLEGFCGSGCQVALLHDHELLNRFVHLKTALVLVHAVNPFGFSHLRRVNEDNIDLNRNFLDFSLAASTNEHYAEVHPLMVPEQWPPSPAIRAAVEAYIAKNGEKALQSAVTIGQNTHPDGLFFSGREAAWSNHTLRQVMREHIAPHQVATWIDIHTGLGPSGYGEKICGSQSGVQELDRARECWGADVVSPYNGESSSAPIRGPGTSAITQECPNTVTSSMALEFGTIPVLAVLFNLRADQWLVNRQKNGEPVTTEQATAIKKNLRDAFYTSTDTWRGAVTVQSRVAFVQALNWMNRNFSS
jgi:predicted deacylase